MTIEGGNTPSEFARGVAEPPPERLLIYVEIAGLYGEPS